MEIRGFWLFIIHSIHHTRGFYLFSTWKPGSLLPRQDVGGEGVGARMKYKKIPAKFSYQKNPVIENLSPQNCLLISV